MKYCTECGGSLSQCASGVTDALRYQCSVCARIQYQNPTIIAGCVVECDGKVLLCKRAIAPRIGTWTLPAGFMEVGESIEEAAVRETYEETNAAVEIDSIYSVFHVDVMDQVYIIYRATMSDTNFSAGEESLEVALFSREDIPWNNLFYPAINDILERFLSDLTRGCSSVYSGNSSTGKVLKVDIS